MALLSVSASASSRRVELPFDYEVRLGWGGYPALDEIYFDSSQYYSPQQYRSSISSLYSDYDGPLYSTGAIYADFSFLFKRWFSLSLGINCDILFGNTYNALTGKKTGNRNVSVFTLIPQARFYYLNREYVRMYSSIGAGLVCGVSRESQELMPAFHVALLGVTVGRKLFGFAEVGTGSIYAGIMAGIGVRF